MDKLKIIANKIGISLSPSAMATKSKESGSERQPISVFTSSWATSFGRNKTDEDDTVVKSDRNEAEGLISFTGADVKNSPKDSAIPFGLLT